MLKLGLITKIYSQEEATATTDLEPTGWFWASGTMKITQLYSGSSFKSKISDNRSYEKKKTVQFCASPAEIAAAAPSLIYQNSCSSKFGLSTFQDYIPLKNSKKKNSGFIFIPVSMSSGFLQKNRSHKQKMNLPWLMAHPLPCGWWSQGRQMCQHLRQMGTGQTRMGRTIKGL